MKYSATSATVSQIGDSTGGEANAQTPTSRGARITSVVFQVATFCRKTWTPAKNARLLAVEIKYYMWTFTIRISFARNIIRNTKPTKLLVIEKDTSAKFYAS